MGYVRFLRSDSLVFRYVDTSYWSTDSVDQRILDFSFHYLCLLLLSEYDCIKLNTFHLITSINYSCIYYPCYCEALRMLINNKLKVLFIYRYIYLSVIFIVT